LDRIKAELDSWKAELSNTVRIYQQFCDKNLELKKREDELLFTVGELEARVSELQKTITRLEERLAELRENNAENANLDPEVFMLAPIDRFIPTSLFVCSINDGATSRLLGVQASIC
jgi:uncharacterized small protein (DUF1192 family)